MSELAIVADNARTYELVESLRDAGVYDDTRHIKPHDDHSVERPVSAVPTDWQGEVIVESERRTRNRGIRDILARRG
jgi:hypothetical protein